MKDIAQVTAAVIDDGMFWPLAQRLAEECKRVLFIPAHWERGFPSLKTACVGAGFENVEHCLDFWPHLKDIGMFCFPDSARAGLQEHLASLGKAVWGSRRGMRLELEREYFMRTLGRLGLEVPPYKVMVGVDQLREHLWELEDKYIKVSKWRGDFETYHWRNAATDDGWLDWLATQFGGLKGAIRFLVFDKIETDLEIGCDTYCVDGQWPDTMLHGLEAKDNTYIGAVTKRAQMPEQIQTLLDAFGPVLGELGHRNQWSMEVRVDGDKFYFIDATPRGGLPSSASQLKLWKNFPSVVWAGANGELLEPEHDDLFSIECMVKSKCDATSWEAVPIDDELLPNLALSSCCLVDGVHCFPPDDQHSGELGWLVATGATPAETLEEAKRLADLLPDGLDANVEDMAALIKEVESMQEVGLQFTRKPMPEPAAAIE